MESPSTTEKPLSVLASPWEEKNGSSTKRWKDSVKKERDVVERADGERRERPEQVATTRTF